MKIGFDGKRAAQNLTGLGNYSRWVISAISKLYPENNYYVYASKIKEAQQVDAFFNLPNVEKKLPISNKFLWRRMGIIKDLIRDRVKIYHGLSQELPFAIQHSKIKTIVTIHDLIFLKHPQYYNWLDKKIYRWKSHTACHVSNKIIAISENTKKDIVELYNILPEKIEVIYQSCDDQFKTKWPEIKLSKVINDYNLPNKYILYVGTIEGRKNLEALVKALTNVDVNYKLVVIGYKKAYYHKTVAPLIKSLQLQDRIHFLYPVSFEDLPGIYQSASMFVMPSYYEGFGIPIIEALYSNIPVIAATGSCLEEAGGEDSLYVDPNDFDGLAKAINLVASDAALREKMIAKGAIHVKKFDSGHLTEQLMNCYKTL